MPRCLCEVKRKLEQMVESKVGIGLGKEIPKFETEECCRTVLLPVTRLAEIIIILPSHTQLFIRNIM